MTEARTETTPQDWWRTSIIEMQPGMIRYRGYPIEDLIGRVGFVDMIYLMTRGELPSRPAARLLEAALVSAVDHGPQAPSIAVARMAITCGIGINNAMASAINTLGDVHGGAGEQCVELYQAISGRLAESERGAEAIKQAAADEIDALKAKGIRHVPGFGHRFHPLDPRAPRLLELVDDCARAGAVGGLFAAIARAVEDVLAERRGGRRVPMNIDGATAVIFAELGFPPPLCRGLFVLSRSVGVLAHAWEESQSDYRNKGPIPRQTIWTYDGPAARPVPEPDGSPE
ncbi:MAG: citryl-CoA lyase [Phreatobacter sp.]